MTWNYTFLVYFYHGKVNMIFYVFDYNKIIIITIIVIISVFLMPTAYSALPT